MNVNGLTKDTLRTVVEVLETERRELDRQLNRLYVPKSERATLRHRKNQLELELRECKQALKQ